MQTINRICTVRPMRHEDINSVIALQRRAFPKMPPWAAHHLATHLKVFPEGQIVAVDATGQVIGSSSSLIVDWSRFDDHASWSDITDDGAFSTHTLDGDTLYGAEIMVDPEARGMGVGSRLYEARRALCRRFNLSRMIAGGRIPGYREVADQMSPEQYVAEVEQGLRRDPVLSFQLANGFRVRGVIASYLAEDQASMGYATLIEWVNVAYHVGQPAA